MICARSLRPEREHRAFCQVVATAARAADAEAVVVACEPQGATLRLRDLAAPARALAPRRPAPRSRPPPRRPTPRTACGAPRSRRCAAASPRPLAARRRGPVLSAALGGSERALRGGRGRSPRSACGARARGRAARRAAPLVVAREPATPFGDGAGGAERWAWGDGARARRRRADAVELGIHATVGGFALLCRCCSGLGHVQ